ncbi:MAG TPA: hypothetical protein VFW15_00595 [Thermoanaerobaculia bacterium]|nr:hypothetical protein [Thermoanaerobaculia bacterium]
MAKKTGKQKSAKKKSVKGAAKRKAPVKKKLTKKVARPAAKRSAKKAAKTKLPSLTVARVAERPIVRVPRIEVRLSAKSPVAPASFRAAPTVGRLLPPPAREE